MLEAMQDLVPFCVPDGRPAPRSLKFAIKLYTMMMGSINLLIYNEFIASVACVLNFDCRQAVHDHRKIANKCKEAITVNATHKDGWTCKWITVKSFISFE